MRVALIHDWILGLRGGERVLDALCELYPSATLFTLFYRPGTTTAAIDQHQIVVSPLNRVPFSQRSYRFLLPLYPWAIERFRLNHYDLVISCSHAVAKGACAVPPAAHLCYCFTPMRYVWDMYDDYQSVSYTPHSNQWGLRLFRHYLQQWDFNASNRIKEFATISNFVSERIRRSYARESEVLYPPVETGFFTPDAERSDPQSYYLLVSAFVPYKRVDTIIAAFNRTKLPLYIVGSGPLELFLRRRAGPSIKFLGRVDDSNLRRLYREARALVYMAKEEFGIVPVEAQACGTPVIAFGEGGVKETVVDGRTGILFPRQTAEDLIEAIGRFNRHQFDKSIIRAHALQFARSRFQEEFSAFTARHS